MSEILEEIVDSLKEYRTSLTPAKRLMHDFLGWGGRTMMLFDRDPTQDEISEWLDVWMEENKTDVKEIFAVTHKPREEGG